jgi:hypothetical protein
MRIGFDFDGVLCMTPFGRFAVHAPGHVDDLPEGWERLYDDRYEPSPLRVAIEYLRFAWRQSSPEAPPVLRALSESHELYIVTGRSDDGVGLVRRWLRRHRLDGCFADIRMAPPGLRPAQHKLATAKLLALDAHIDDDPRTAYHLARNGVPAVYLLDHAGVHGGEPPPERVTLIRSLNEFAARVDHKP